MFSRRLEDYLGCVVLGRKDDKICSAPHLPAASSLLRLLPRKKIFKWEAHTPRAPAAPGSAPCLTLY